MHNTTSTGKANKLSIIGGLREIQGFGFGLRDPSIYLRIEVTPLDPTTASHIWQSCAAIAGKGIGARACPQFPGSALTATGNWLLDLLFEVQSLLGQRIHSKGEIVEVMDDQLVLVVPTPALFFGQTKALIVALLEMIKRWPESQNQDFAKLCDQLSQLRPKSSNVERFFKASCELDLPCFDLPIGITQYGQGSRACWLNSSLTNATPSLSARLARNKSASLAYLRNAGLPTTIQAIAKSEEAALQIAHDFGYPIVVKPNNLDGGAGVAAGLETPHEVSRAYRAASKLANDILVEKHFDGRDHRLTVFQGQLIWAIERLPAGVDGNGVSTIGELIAATNADPNRGASAQSALRPIDIDEEVLAVLKKQNLDLNCVPADGVRTRLRRISNVATGGYPVGVLDKVHPDNAALAVRAAQLLGLDLAGIDLLIPDISLSWRVCGAAICEVNGQPTLGQTTAAHLYAEILSQLVTGGGRVPSVLVVGETDGGKLVHSIGQKFTAKGLKVGLHTAASILIGDEHVGTPHLNTYQAGRMLALNRDVDAIVLSSSDFKSLQDGLGISRFDAVILASHWRENVNLGDGTMRPGFPDIMANFILGACDGIVFERQTTNPVGDQLKSITGANWQSCAKDTDALADDVCSRILQISAHRNGEGRY